MPRPESHIQSDLSISYLNAIAAHAGYSFIAQEKNDYGVDGQIRYVGKFNNQYIDQSALFEVQLKSKTDATVKDEHIIYDLDVKAHTRLLVPCSIPRILILFCLPEKFTDWLNCDEDLLALKRAAYWLWPQDLPTLGKQKDTIRIKVPRKNLLTPAALDALAKPYVEALK